MIAAFDEQCEICTGDIEAGYTEVTYNADRGGWIHLRGDDCSDEHPENETDEFATD